MPIDYKKYPKNWKSEIRPRIMSRANNTCEFDGCDFNHGQIVYSVKVNGIRFWYPTILEALQEHNELEDIKRVKVVLTIAHLDHDEGNINVSDDRLKAACQLCHLRYDSKEKAKRRGL